MIIENNIREIEISSSFEETAFKIEASATVMKLLRSSIYSNPIAAVIRESAANMTDAHVFAGIGDRPIDVTLPSYLEPTLKIRDYGNSMNHETVMDLYATYGRSTKNNSNDFIGAMGIGKFSPFSYVPCFQLTCIQNNFKRIYQMYLDESDKGKIALIHEGETSEENGTEVSLGVEIKDIDIFVSEAENLFQFWKVKPIVSGNKNYKDKTPNYILGRPDSWGILGSGDSYIVMGGIRYRFDISFIKNHNAIQEKLIYGIILFANIGDIDIAASRETAQATNKTTKFIIEKLRQVEEDIKNDFDEKIKGIKSEYEARKLFHEANSKVSKLSRINDVLGGNKIIWNGEEISSYVFPFSAIKIYSLTSPYDRNYSKRITKLSTIQFVNIFDADLSQSNIHYFFYDLKNKTEGKIKKMIKHYKTLTNSIQEYTVIQPKNLADLHSWCDSKGVPREIFKDIDEVITLPKAIKVKAGNAMPSGFNAQIYDAEDFLSDKDDYEVITENGECLNLINVEDFGEPHYYLIRNGKNYGCAEMGFGRILNLLKTFDPKFVDHPVVYVFTQRYSEKVENWKEIGQFLKEKIQEHWSKCEIYSYYKNVFYGDRAELIRMIKCAAGRGEITNSKILNLLNKINFSNSYSYGEFASYLGIAPKINSGQEELKEFNKILKDYPLLASINPDKYDKHVSDYINVEK